MEGREKLAEEGRHEVDRPGSRHGHEAPTDRPPDRGARVGGAREERGQDLCEAREEGWGEVRHQDLKERVSRVSLGGSTRGRGPIGGRVRDVGSTLWVQGCGFKVVINEMRVCV